MLGGGIISGRFQLITLYLATFASKRSDAFVFDLMNESCCLLQLSECMYVSDGIFSTCAGWLAALVDKLEGACRFSVLGFGVRRQVADG